MTATFTLPPGYKLQPLAAEKEPNKIIKFTTDLVDAAWTKIKEFAIGLWHNKQGVAILTLAVNGACGLIGEIPFHWMLPAWVEGPMVVPVVSVLLILGLIKWAKRSEKKRFAAAAE